jgi:hypothetical protein
MLGHEQKRLQMIYEGRWLEVETQAVPYSTDVVWD